MKKSIVHLIVMLITPIFGIAQEYDDSNREDYDFKIRDIKIIRKEVFEKEDPDWFFASPFGNWFHSLSREYLIRDELLFEEDSYIKEDILFETERNLRKLELFTNVKIELDSISDDTYDAYITTKDRWSFYPEPLFGFAGGERQLGLSLEEYNLFGTGTNIEIEGLHRTENEIGWQGRLLVRSLRLFRSDFGLEFQILSHRFRTEKNFNFEKPYRTLKTEMAYGIEVTNNYGDNFLYINQNDYKRIYTRENRAEAYFSKAWSEGDRIFISTLLSLEDVKRDSIISQRAYDNSGKFLLQFSSVSNKFYIAKNVNQYLDEDLIVGGYGSATLGKIFPIGNKGESLFYIAGEGEQSFYNKKMYLFGRVRGASAFYKNISTYSYQEFFGLGFYQFNKYFSLGSRIRQQTVWNWGFDRQLILDAETGLRGYLANDLQGANRIFYNLEARVFPDITLWLVNISGVLFWDTGTVWDEQTKIWDTKWHNAIGTGIRFHFTKSGSPKHTMKIDFAYNFDERKPASIMISSHQFFSFFEKHDYKKPEIFGLEYDYE